VSKLRNNNVLGPDEVTAEILKLSGEKGAKILRQLCNEVWIIGSWPRNVATISLITHA